MLAGAASISITPSVGSSAPVWLAGFEPGRAALGVRDELRASALILEAEGRRVALVSLDLIGLFRGEVERIRRLADVQELDLDHLVVACTHTHSGPDTLGLWGEQPGSSGVDAAYLQHVQRGVVAALKTAAAALRPAELQVAGTTTPGLIRDTIAPHIVDERLLVLRVVEAGGAAETVAHLVNWGNHAEVLWGDSRVISADFPGALCREMEARYGGVCLFMAGAIGGLMTPDQVPVVDPESGARVAERSPEKVDALGRILADLCAEALRDGFPVDSRELFIQQVRFPVRLDNPGFRAGLANGQLRRDDLRHEDGAWFLESEVSSVRIGSVVLLAIPGEIYPELVLGGVLPPQDPQTPRFEHPPLNAPLAPGHLFLLGLANDELGYIIPPTQWDLAPHGGPGFNPAAAHSTSRELAGELFAALEGCLESPRCDLHSGEATSPADEKDGARAVRIRT